MSLQLTQTHSFLWLSKIPFYIYITVNYLPIHVDGHLGCFHVLGSINSAAMNIEVHVSFWIMVFSGYMPNSGTAGSYGSFLRNPQMFSIVDYLNLHSHQQFKSIPFLHILSSIYCLYIFWWWPLWFCVKLYLIIIFIFFYNKEQCLAPFYVFFGHLHVFFGEMSV